VAISPERVAELLILQPTMPRSLLFCMNGVVKSLELLANRHSGEAIERARQLRGQLCEARIEPILARGLHGYLSDFMDRIYELGDDISHDFLTRANQTD
jgi:uncharacterized alpha-E superfamily protein